MTRPFRAAGEGSPPASRDPSQPVKMIAEWEWPLGPIVINHLASALRIGEREAALKLQDMLRAGAVRSRGPLSGAAAEPIAAEFWRYAFPEPSGEALNFQTLQRLDWFEVCAADVLAPTPRPDEPPAPAGHSAPAPRPERVQSATKPAAVPRGRRPTYIWEPACLAVSNELVTNGFPRQGDGGQARLEKLARDTFSADRAPSESSVRSKVAGWIKDYRKANGA